MSSNLEKPDKAQDNPPIAPELLEDAIKIAEHFLRTEAPSLGRIFGIDLDIQLGRGWVTDLESGKVTADLRFFIDRGYTPDMAVYAVLHEVAAHLQEAVMYPEHTKDVIFNFDRKGEAYSIFHNIFGDITGNKQIHAILPSMRDVAAQTYSEKLFPEDDYTTSHPRHIQFLYAIIRDEMIPNSQTAVRPEVAEAIASLRDFQGMGDLIKYSTSPVKEGTKQSLSPQERCNIWLAYILPVYEQLIKLDKEDPLELDKPNDSDNSNSNNQQSTGANDQTNNNQGNPEKNNQNTTNKPSTPKEKRPKNPNYEDFYKEYIKTRHPEPDEIKHIHEPKTKEKTPEQKIAKEFKEKTGFSLKEKQNYDKMIRKNQLAINAMREAFMKIIIDRITKVKKLKGRHKEGALLNPDNLAQTFIDITSGIEEPPAFLDYQRISAEREITGKTDYYFVIDTSGSMQGVPARQAANALVVALEGLSAMERDIARLERQEGVETDLDIKTAVYTFSETARCIKPLSGSLDDKTRLTAIHETLAANGSATNDFLALEQINALIPNKSERRQIIFVITDGESSMPTYTQAALSKLRAKGVLVIGVAIGSQSAVNLYSPTSELVNNPPIELPKLLEKLIVKGF